MFNQKYVIKIYSHLNKFGPNFMYLCIDATTIGSLYMEFRNSQTRLVKKIFALFNIKFMHYLFPWDVY